MRLKFSAFRILFGLTVMVIFYREWIFGVELISDEGIFSDAGMGLPSVWVTPFFMLLILLSSCLALGFYRRWAAAFLCLGWAFLNSRMIFVSVPSHGYIGWLLVVCAVLPSGEPWSLSKRVEDWELPKWIQEASWFIVGLSYTASGLDKTVSLNWTTGRAMALVGSMPDVNFPWIADTIGKTPNGLLVWLTMCTLALEVLCVFLYTLRETRALAWLCMTALHLTILCTFNIQSVSLLMLLVQLLLFDPNWLKFPRLKEALLNWPAAALLFLVLSNAAWLTINDLEPPRLRKVSTYSAPFEFPEPNRPEVYCTNWGFGAWGQLTLNGSVQMSNGKSPKSSDFVPAVEKSVALADPMVRPELESQGILNFMPTPIGRELNVFNVRKSGNIWMADYTLKQWTAFCLNPRAKDAKFYWRDEFGNRREGQLNIIRRPAVVEPFDGGPQQIGREENIRATILVFGELPNKEVNGISILERMAKAVTLPFNKSLWEGFSSDKDRASIMILNSLQRFFVADYHSINWHDDTLSWTVEGRFTSSNRRGKVNFVWQPLDGANASRRRAAEAIKQAVGSSHFVAILIPKEDENKIDQLNFSVTQSENSKLPYQLVYLGAPRGYQRVPESLVRSLQSESSASIRDIVVRAGLGKTDVYLVSDLLRRMERESQGISFSALPERGIIGGSPPDMIVVQRHRPRVRK